jgi:hypothetical protein
MADATTVIFWGAGATASLGMRTTEKQGKFIARLAGADLDNSQKSLTERVSDALGDSDKPYWHDAIFDLITILGDTESAYNSIDIVEQEHLDAMARHWRPGATKGDLHERIMELRIFYDWPALKDVLRKNSKSTIYSTYWTCTPLSAMVSERRRGFSTRGAFLAPRPHSKCCCTRYFT